MKFTYTYLKNAEDNNMRVGAYNGKDVYAISKNRLMQNESEKYMYIIYDDNNYLYNNGMIYATISENGNVNDFRPKRYVLESKREEPKPAFTQTTKAAETTTAPTSGEEVMGDVMLGLLVDDTLRGARETTIDSLLEGFNYGL